MKKTKLIITLTLLFLVCTCSTALANDWTIEVNGKPIDGEVKIIDGRSLVPLRAIGEALGIQVTYYETTKVIGLEYHAENDVLTYAYVWLDFERNYYDATVENYNNPKHKLNVPEKQFHMYVQPVNIDGRVYVPVRLISSTFGAPLSVVGTHISIGEMFTADEYSVKSINDLIYSENSTLQIPKEAEITTTTTTQNTTSTKNDLRFMSTEGTAVLDVARRISNEENNFSTFTSAKVAKSSEYDVVYVQMNYQIKGSYDVLVDKVQYYYVINNKLWTVDEYEDLDSLSSYEEQKERAYSALDFDTDASIMFKTGQFLTFDGSSIMQALGY